MWRVAIFIDGGYLAKVLRHEFNEARIDYQKLADHIANCIHKEADILRTYCYHCLPYKGDPPTPEESKRFERKQRFVDALRCLPRFEVRLGRLVKHGPDLYRQKGIDTLLSIDLVRLSTKGQITHVAIVAGDADFVPAIKVACDEGVSAWLFHGQHVSNELWKLVLNP